MIDAMKTSSRCLAVLVGVVVAVLAFNPTVGSADTVTVTVGNGGPVFTPSSVTILPGDTVRWTWSMNNHSSTSGISGRTQRTLGLRDSHPGSYVHSHFQHRGVVSVLLYAAWAMLRNDRQGDGGESDGASDRHN